jgi:VCBS repeat-containing protein
MKFTSTALLEKIAICTIFICLILNLPTVSAAENNPPSAVNDSYSIQTNLILTVSAPGILTNDTDINSDDLTCLVKTTTEHGSLILNADGSFNYTPEKDFTGNDFFTYICNDGKEDSNIATVGILVTPSPNTTPKAIDDIYSMVQNISITVPAPGILENDFDEEGKTLIAEKITNPLYGTLELSTDGSFSYTPKINFTGLDSFTYKTFDGELYSESATVTIKVESSETAPQAENDLYTASTGTLFKLKAPGILENDKVMPGKTLTAILETNTLYGTCSLEADGAFKYSANSGFSGKDFLKYKVNDGKITSSPGFVIINVIPPLPTKVLTNEDEFVVEKNKSFVLCAPGLTQNDPLPDNWPTDQITVKLKTLPEHGSVSIQPNGALVYVPQKNYAGLDSFYYRVILSKGSLTVKSPETKVSLKITTYTDKIPPFPVNDLYYTDLNTTLNIPVAAGLLANDTYANDNITVALGETTSRGTVSLNADGSFTYAPPNGEIQDDSFSYFIKFGTNQTKPATVKIKINPPGGFNSAPVAIDDLYSTAPATDLQIPAPGLIFNDYDKDNDQLYASLEKSPQNGTVTINENGSFTYTPKKNFTGKDVFTYSLSDHKLNSEIDGKVTITVSKESAANHPPIAINDYYEINEDLILNMGNKGPLSNDSDQDGNPLTLTLISHPEHGKFYFDKKSNTYLYIPNWGFTGADRFSYIACDPFSESNKATVDITIHKSCTNLPPISIDDIFATSMNQKLNIPAPGVMSNDFDPNRYSSLKTLKLSDTKNGSIELNKNGSFTYTPNNGFSGEDSFYYMITDGSLNSNKTTVKILVENNIISIGSKLTFKAENLQGLNGTFIKNPQIYATLPFNKKANLKKASNAKLQQIAEAIWTKKICLYDKKNLKEMGYQEWFKNNIQNPLTCEMNLKYLTVDNDIANASAGTYLLVPPTFDYFTQNGKKTNSIIKDTPFSVIGRFFGSKRPKISIISNDTGKQKKLKIITPLEFEDYKGIPGKSCMNIKNGFSQINLLISKKLPPGKYLFILNNKIGIAVDPEKHLLPEIEIK